MILTTIIIVCYVLLIASLIIGFNKVATVIFKNTSPQHTFSIIVVFRNEANNLATLLHSFSKLNYPKNLFEIILVNDTSNDDFEKVITSFKKQFPEVYIVQLNIINAISPKKEAITLGVQHAQFKWIVTTDADCEVPKNWLHIFNQYIQEKNPKLISAPVVLSRKHSFLFQFQDFNFVSLIGSTIGAFGIKKPFLCNGANLCYSKSVFLEVDGFQGNLNQASGDDIFLLEKITKKYATKVHFLKSDQAVVVTKPLTSWKYFFNQQLRWASKARAYKNSFAIGVGILVFTANLIIVLTLILTIFNIYNYKLLLLVFILKMGIDFLMIFKTLKFLNLRKSLAIYLVVSFLYPFFIIFTGLISLVKKYEWKGRIFTQ